MIARAALAFPVLALWAAAAGAAAATPVEKPVYRVDSVIATAQGDFIVIQAKGAVQSGGWKAPRLRVTHGDAHTLVINFVAQPPSTDAAVIMGLLPIAAAARVRARHNLVTVRAVAAANDITTQILH